MKHHLPHQWVRRVENILVADLLLKDIRGVLLDVDQTLVDWHTTELRPEVLFWIAELKENGILICLVSNTIRGKRLKGIAELLDVPFIPCGVIPGPGNKRLAVMGAKPHRSAYERGLAVLGLLPSEVAMVGDQLYTDVKGALRYGIGLVILVTPSSKKENFVTKLKRPWEKRLLDKFVKKGLLKRPTD